MTGKNQSSICIGDVTRKFSSLLKPKFKLTEDIQKTFIGHLTGFDEIQTDSLVFVAEPKKFSSPVAPRSVVLPLNAEVENLKFFEDSGSYIFLSPNPKLAMALVSREFFAPSKIATHHQFCKEDIHPTALIHPSAQLAPGVKIGPYCVIGPHCILEEQCKLASHVVIEDQVKIGAFSEIFSHVILGARTQLGSHCIIQSHCGIGTEGFGYATDKEGHHHGIPHMGHVEIEDYVHIGASCQIDRGTFGFTCIRSFTKLDNLIHIAHNCKIGKSCLITAGFLMAGSSEIGDFFVTGGGSAIAGHIKVTDNVQLAGFSSINKSLSQPGKYGGHPSVSLKDHMKNQTTSTKLFKFRKDLNRILKHLKLK